MPDYPDNPHHQKQNCANTPASPTNIAAQHWQRLVDAACSDQQVATARVLRTEGMLQLALEQGAVDEALLLQWGTQAAQRLAAAIPNPLWPASVIHIDDGDVRIVMLHKRAPVVRSTKD
jgi:hypothetical protein